MTSALVGLDSSATSATITAPAVAPTKGIKPRKPTTTASTAAYGSPTIFITT